MVRRVYGNALRSLCHPRGVSQTAVPGIDLEDLLSCLGSGVGEHGLGWGALDPPWAVIGRRRYLNASGRREALRPETASSQPVGEPVDRLLYCIHLKFTFPRATIIRS